VKLAIRATQATLAGRMARAALVCALLALVLSQVAGISFLDAYLATTPGGLYAVLATAVSTGANTTFVLAVQSLRLLVMIAAAPAIVRGLAGRDQGGVRPPARARGPGPAAGSGHALAGRPRSGSRRRRRPSGDDR